MFARWTNGLYYRGFVTSVSSTTVHVNYDDGDTITLPKTDLEAVILDTLVCYSDVRPGQRVIGFWPGRTRYYPGVVQSKVVTGNRQCFQKQVYNVAFDDGDKRKEDFNQIRLLPWKSVSSNKGTLERKSRKPLKSGCRLALLCFHGDKASSLVNYTKSD